MSIGAKDIRRLIPHSGRMCLLDGVLVHDERHIFCTAVSHTETGNPLRANDALSAIHALEYAAQAMALHSALTRHASATPAEENFAGSQFVVAAAHDIEMRVRSLHDIVATMEITATMQAKTDAAAMYGFLVEAGHRLLVSGRLTVTSMGGQSR